MKEQDKELYAELKASNYKPRFYGEKGNKVYPYGLRRKYVKLPVNTDLPKDIKPSFREIVYDLFKRMSLGQVLMKETSSGQVPMDKQWIKKHYGMTDRTCSDLIASLKKNRVLEEVLYIKKKQRAYMVNPKYCMSSIFVGAEVMYIFQDDMDLTGLGYRNIREIVKEEKIDEKIRSVKNGR